MGGASYVMTGCYCFTLRAYVIDSSSALSYLKSLALFLDLRIVYSTTNDWYNCIDGPKLT